MNKQSVTLEQIKDFLAPKRMIIAGVSRNPKKFGRIVFDALTQRGFELYPVHPEANEINGIKCYRHMDEIPTGIECLYLVTPGKVTCSLVEEAVRNGVRKIWIQQSCDTPEAVELAEKNGITLITRRCILMFAEPVESIHAFHRWLARLFGTYPGTVSLAREQI